jgi:RNA:NAD 2''-phosphotransferase
MATRTDPTDEESAPKKERSRDELKTLSKALSWVLRHAAPQLNLSISSDGFIPVPALLSVKARNLCSYTEDDVLQVVATNDKQRFRLDTKIVRFEKRGKGVVRYEFVTQADELGERVLCIRANQGHSIKSVTSEELLSEIDPVELTHLQIIHGTNKTAWDNHIRNDGLNKMNRNHIHFAAGMPGDDGVISGMRRTCQIYIYINGEACAQDGIKFFRSDNGCILTSGIAGVLPCKYFKSVIDAKSGKDIFLCK